MNFVSKANLVPWQASFWYAPFILISLGGNDSMVASNRLTVRDSQTLNSFCAPLLAQNGFSGPYLLPNRSFRKLPRCSRSVNFDSPACYGHLRIPGSNHCDSQCLYTDTAPTFHIQYRRQNSFVLAKKSRREQNSEAAGVIG